MQIKYNNNINKKHFCNPHAIFHTIFCLKCASIVCCSACIWPKSHVNWNTYLMEDFLK